MTTKETVLAVLERLPDDCTIEDVQYHLYVTQAIAAGLADSEAGRVVPHELVDEELRRKWLIGSDK
jgi:predicted transcriptional regulator